MLRLKIEDREYRINQFGFEYDMTTKPQNALVTLSLYMPMPTVEALVKKIKYHKK